METLLTCHKQKKTRVTPICKAFRCANELMCILQTQNGDKDIEQLYEDEKSGQNSCQPRVNVTIDDLKRGLEDLVQQIRNYDGRFLHYFIILS